MFLGSIKVPVPPSRPAIPSASRVGPVKFAACGGTGATRSPRFWGEHGEDPQFGRAYARCQATAKEGGAANTNKPNDRRIGTELTADIRWRVNRHLLLGLHVAA